MPSQLDKFWVEREKWELLYFYSFSLYVWNIFFISVQQVLQQQPTAVQLWGSRKKSNEMLSGDQLQEH